VHLGGLSSNQRLNPVKTLVDLQIFLVDGVFNYGVVLRQEIMDEAARDTRFFGRHARRIRDLESQLL
jgi:hypothetical protein